MATDHFTHNAAQLGRTDWNFNITFEPAQVESVVKSYWPLLQTDALHAPIPMQWLHCTILRVGFMEDFTEAEMLAAADHLQQTLSTISAPQVAFDSWWLWGGNVILHMSPDDKLTKIYDAVIDALQTVVGPERTPSAPHGGFIPHMTLAYTKTHNQEFEIQQQLAKNDYLPSPFTVSKVSLLKQQPVDGYYEWDVVRQVRIGA